MPNLIAKFKNLFRFSSPLSTLVITGVALLVVGGCIFGAVAMKRAGLLGTTATGTDTSSNQSTKKNADSSAPSSTGGNSSPAKSTTGSGTTQNTSKGTTSSGGGGTSGSTPSGGGSSSSCSGAAHHVAGGPDGTGTCWPGPNNTGVPAGTTLTAYTGPYLITTAGTVIDSKLINCTDFEVRAASVVIKNSKVNCNITLDGDLSGSSGWSLTVQDSEVNGGPVDLPAIGSANVTVLRSNVYGGHNGVQCDEKTVSCLIQDSWIHGQYQPQNYDSHLGGFLSDGGQNITIKHNFIVCDAAVNNVGGGCTGDINLIPNFAAINGALIEHNLLGANIDSSFCTYGGEKPGSPTPHSYNVVYKDNVFQRGSNGLCDAYGPVSDFNVNGAGNQWINNTWDNGGAVDPAL